MMLITFVLIQAAVMWQLNGAQMQAWHSRHSYPNPLRSERMCSRSSQSYICDPDHIIVPSEADQLNTLLASTVNETRCPCSRYSCGRNPEGYKIGIALTKQIRPDEEFRSNPNDERDEHTRRTEWILNEAKLFAHELLDKWDMGRCDEDVLIFYSHVDGVLYTAVGDVARMKLNHTVIKAIAMNARGDFGPGGNIFRGLLKIVKEYRSVFFGSYNPNAQPKTGRLSSGGSGVEPTGSFRLIPVLVTSLIFVVLTCLIS